jgi:hypothetical protein
VRPGLENMRKRKRLIFKMKIKLAERKSSPDWKMADLKRALKNLKNGKSKDFEGYINNILKMDVIRSDLKKSLLLMLNKLKKKKKIPMFLNFTNVTTVHKKGSRIEPKNERGIFWVSVIRYIPLRLICNMKYPIIDKNLSDCQMGARKNKGCKNNIFIINGITCEVLKT